MLKKVLQHFSDHPETDWVLFIDCDAFFTNFDVSPWDLLETYVYRDSETGEVLEPSKCG